MSRNGNPVSRVRPLSFAILILASATALADEAATDNNGAMQFSNVTVINAPATEVVDSSNAMSGMRAQKDRITGELRMPTAAEAAELDALAPPPGDQEVYTWSLPDGAVGAELTSAHLSYSIVRKDAQGRLVQDCVTGESAADHAMHQAPVAAEVRHDR